MSNDDLVAMARQLIPLIDLTSLNVSDNQQTILQLGKKACTPYGNVAAICVFPQFVPFAVANTPVAVATVCNFPSGTRTLNATLQEIRQAIAQGAREIDVVIPYHNLKLVGQFIEACKQVCGENIILKSIIETGALIHKEIIQEVCEEVILAKTDFIKTSTGKISPGATIEHAKIILNTIKNKGKQTGFKASGGIQTVSQAIDYLKLIEAIMGKSWISPLTCRFGASKLLDDAFSFLSTS